MRGARYAGIPRGGGGRSKRIVTAKQNETPDTRRREGKKEGGRDAGMGECLYFSRYSALDSLSYPGLPPRFLKVWSRWAIGVGQALDGAGAV